MTPHLPQTDTAVAVEEEEEGGGREGFKSTAKLSRKAGGCLWARVQLTDKAFDSDALLRDGNKYEQNFKNTQHSLCSPPPTHSPACPPAPPHSLPLTASLDICVLFLFFA